MFETNKQGFYDDELASDLNEMDEHENERVRRKASFVCIVHFDAVKELLQNQNYWFQIFVVFRVRVYEVDAFQAMMF